jgi:OOP family OmpA-OmpF porin
MADQAPGVAARVLMAIGASAIIGLAVIGLFSLFENDEMGSDTIPTDESPTTTATTTTTVEPPPTVAPTTIAPAAPPATTLAPPVTSPPVTEPPTSDDASESAVAVAETTIDAATDAIVEAAVAENEQAEPVDGSDSSDDEVPESRATVRDGQIYLEGAVPDETSSAEIEALAAEVLGPDNVFNEYIIDPRAGDPNLGNITVEDTINFRSDSAEILPEAEGLLNQGLALMTIRPAMTITIVGHTDSLGTDEHNQDLSERRAESVKSWFVERGIEPDRLDTEGRGEDEPIATNDSLEGRRLNRRIQFFLVNVLAEA